MSDVMLVEKSGGIATVTFNRPKFRNAVDQTQVHIFQEVFAGLKADRDLRAVVLRGAGDHFMAGGDLNFFAGMLEFPPAERRRRFEEVVHAIHPVVLAIRDISAPVIASVRGGAAGWGMSLVMACDLAIAADDAFFSLGYCKIGVCPEGSGSYYLPRMLGLKKAMEVALLSDRIDASAALALGLVNKVVPVAELESATREYAERLATGATRAFGVTKRLLNRSLSSTLEDQLDAEAAGFGECAATEDFAEGVKAFMAKRKPVYAGR